MEKEIRFCRDAEGNAIAYMRIGQGPMLIVPPGWVSHLEQQWELPGVRAFFEQLATHHTLLVFDKLGTGLSERKRTDFTLDKDVRDLEAVVDAVGADRFSIFGYSMGGPLAIAFAARHPQRIDKLILYGTFANGDAVSPEAVRNSIIALVRANWGMGANLLSWLFVPHKSGDPDAAQKISVFQRHCATAEMAARLLELFFVIDVTDLLPGLDIPTLVIHRRGDRPVPMVHGRELATRIPNARFVLLDGTIHFPWLGNVDDVLLPLFDFLGDHPLPASAPDRQSPAVTAAVAPKSKESAGTYRFVLHDLQSVQPRVQPERCRVGIAQIDLPMALLEERGGGLVGLRASGVDAMRRRIDTMLEKAVRQKVNLLVFPEMTVDMNHAALSQTIFDAAAQHDMVIVPGACHDPETRMNISRIIGPQGVLWEQTKHIPAMMTIDGRKLQEGIATDAARRIVVANTALGRVAVVICRDFLDMDLRVEIKNFTPPVDVVVNPALTPVTTDFTAAHMEARRSIYAYFFFCNIASQGNSSIYSPEKGRRKRVIPQGKEDLIFKDIHLFNLRAERRKWELVRERKVRFIQSTR